MKERTSKVSVIVPTRNSGSTLTECLASIKNQSYSNLEIIVIDNGSSDKTVAIASKMAHKVFQYGPERSAQRNFGAVQATGDWYLFIDSDMVLQPHVVKECITQVTSNPKVKALVIPEESYGEGFWAQCKRLERSFYVGVEWMEAARFFSASVFTDLHGYDEKNTGTEDYDLPQRLTAKWGNSAIARTDSTILHNEGKLSLMKTMSKKFYYAHKLERYSSVLTNKAQFQKQASPLERYKLFFANPRKLFADPITGIGMLILKTAEFFAGAMGYIDYMVKRLIDLFYKLIKRMVRFVEIDWQFLSVPGPILKKISLVLRNNWIVVLNHLGFSIRSLSFEGKSVSFDTPYGLKTFFAAVFDFYVETERLSIFETAEPLIIDVGANVGQFQFAVKYCLPNAQVVSFEPDPDVFAYLRHNAANFTNTTAVNYGLSSKDQTLVFYKSKQFSEWSGFEKDVNSGEFAELSLEVKVGDKLLSQYPNIDLLKIDVEGGEIEVLKGLVKSLKKTKAVLIETSLARKPENSYEVIKSIHDQGLSLHRFGRIFAANTYSPQGAIDLLFVRRQET